MKGNRQGSLSRLITRRSDQNRLSLNGRRYFLHISQKALASENVFGYTVPIPTGVRHSTLCCPPAKDKEEYPLWLAVRQCGDLS